MSEEEPFNEEDEDGSFVLPTPSSSSSSSYVSDNDEDEFEVSSDEVDEMDSDPACGNIDASTVIGTPFFYATTVHLTPM